ncbi:MAG: FAD-dependent oxidoreductase [Gemmatimonadaceae bacterium]
MSRTPLFGLVQRSLRVAQLAATRREPLDEAIDRVLLAPRPADTRATMSRRRFVAVSAAASAALVLDACLPRRGSGTGLPSPRRDVEPVLIIGAGIAGLTAAYRLRQHGVPVRVFEAQQRVGGRMFSLRDTFADGQLCELGGELIDSNHTSIRALAQELGIELDDLRQTDAGFDADVWWVAGARRTTAEVIIALAPVAAQLDLGHGTAEDQARTMVADLDRIFPGSRAAHEGMKAVRFQWPSFPWTLGSYAGYLPGQWTSIRGAEGEPVGRLFFAGEHCSLASQGFMNGGCETGEAAAREILASLRVAGAKPVRRLIAV